MKVFFSYSHTDEGRRKRLRTHVAVLRREGYIEEWFDRLILAGDVLDAEIQKALEECDLFLPLVSPDFLASDYCYEREMTIALERHRANEARVVPIIIEPCDWRHTPLGELKAVPRDGEPVALWDNENDAYLDVVKELRRIIKAHHAQHSAVPGIASLAGMLEVPQTEAFHRSSSGTSKVRELPVVDTIWRGRGGDHYGLRGTDDTQVRNAMADRPNGPRTTRRYRRKRDFDEIDRAEFREMAFATIREHFEREIAELTSLGGVRARFVPRSETSFSCTVVNKALDHGTAHITVHTASGNRTGIGDVSYSYQENSPPGSANGFFTIENDEYELYLQSIMMMYGHDRERLTTQQAAEAMWANFIEQAGISYC